MRQALVRRIPLTPWRAGRFPTRRASRVRRITLVLPQFRIPVRRAHFRGNRHEETGCCGGTRNHVDLIRSASSRPRRKRCPGRGFGIGRFWTGGRSCRCGGRIYGRTCDRPFLGHQATRTRIQGSAHSTIRLGNETTNCRRNPAASNPAASNPAASNPAASNPAASNPAACSKNSATAGCPGSGSGRQHKGCAANSDVRIRGRRRRRSHRKNLDELVQVLP
jgi:hypothetical protein